MQRDSLADDPEIPVELLELAAYPIDARQDWLLILRSILRA